MYNLAIHYNKVEILRPLHIDFQIACSYTYLRQCHFLKKLGLLLNSFKSHLQFTMDCSAQKVHFLDMWIIKENSILVTTLYRKETDKNTLLLTCLLKLTLREIVILSNCIFSVL